MKMVDKLISLWNGNIVQFNREELIWLLDSQNSLHINTLSIQQTYDGLFYCKADQATANAFKEFED